MRIEDFGEKIGGAKKDIWKNRSLEIDDIISMNDREMISNVKKNNIWKKPDYEQLASQGYSIRKLYFMKTVRDAIPTKPILDINSNIQEQCSNYINAVTQLEKECMEIGNDEAILSFYKEKFLNTFVKRASTFSQYVDVMPEYKSVVNNKLLKAVQVPSLFFLDKEIKNKRFCYSENEKLLANYQFLLYDSSCHFGIDDFRSRTMITIKKTYGSTFLYPRGNLEHEANWKKDTYFIIKDYRIIANNFDTVEKAQAYALALEKTVEPTQTQGKKKRKEKYKPVQLQHIKRTGEDYRHGMNIRGEDYLKKFNFRGGEFGNYMNESDRLHSLNFGYDALLDLAHALHIDPKDISLGGQLSIAFGARGHGNALAHYEPNRTVINLTKMRGAGSLAHEWAHALDDYIARKLNLPINSFATDHYSSKIVSDKLPSLKKLMTTIKYGENENSGLQFKKSVFYSNALEMDKNYSKEAHGYWSSNVEMFARVFACYIHDKLGYRSDYLCGHAYAGTLANDVCTYPRGKEMENISHCIDNLFTELKTLEYVHEYTEPAITNDKKIEEKKTETIYDYDLHEESNGQFSLFDLEDERSMDY
jgi:hypothetical protein